MSALLLSSTARAERVRRVWLDLLVGPMALVIVLLCSLLVPVRGYAQNMTLGQLIPDLIRNTSQTVSASSAGLQVAEAGSVGIRSGSSLIGSVAINELRSIPLGAIAGRAVTSSAPVILAMLAVDLIKYGITQCASSPNGWCKPGPTNPSSSDSGFNGFQWRSANAYGDSPVAACTAYVSGAYPGMVIDGYDAASGVCHGHFPSDPRQCGGVCNIVVQQVGTCVTGYVASGNACVVDPSAHVQPVPITYPELSPKLADALSGNPQRAKDYWGFMPWTDQLAALGDPSTQALPAQIVNPADGRVTGPSTTTQGPNGTTTQRRSCTVSPNSDSSSLANKPVSVVCTVTTTNPDGTTSTTTTTTTPTTGDGSNPQPASSPAAVPASSPTPLWSRYQRHAPNV